MKTQEDIIIDFYQNLGKLFYAIAATDKKVHPAEVTKLQELVEKYWLDVSVIEDVHYKDGANKIVLFFQTLNNEGKLSAKTCFKDFVTYKNENKHLFTDNLKRLIIKTATEMAYAFSGLNKSELIVLAKLDIELKNI